MAPMATTTTTTAAPTPASNSEAAAGGFFAEWRQSVNDQLAESARVLRDVTSAATKLTTQVSELERRISTLEHSPAEARSFLGTYGGCIGQVVYAGISGFGVLISITAIVLSIVLR